MCLLTAAGTTTASPSPQPSLTAPSAALPLVVPLHAPDLDSRSQLSQPDVPFAPRPRRLQRRHAGFTPIPSPPGDGRRFGSPHFARLVDWGESPTCDVVPAYRRGARARHGRGSERKGSEGSGRLDARSCSKSPRCCHHNCYTPSLNPSSCRETDQRDPTGSR